MVGINAPNVIKQEILRSFSGMKNCRTSADVIKLLGEKLLEAVTKLFNKCLEETTSPVMWNYVTILIKL